MSLCKLINCCLAFAVCLAMTPAVSGQFLTENFDYPDGNLTEVSGGLWAQHSGGDPPTNVIQVVGGEAVVVSPGDQDDNRQIGMELGPTETWFYAVRFTLSDNGTINNDYFIHFRPDVGFGFRARLAPSAPADPANDFSLQIWASSAGDGMTDWDGDFSFGEEIVAVVRWENEFGVATLWVNPVDESSTNVSDDELEDAMEAITSIALRQDSGTGYIANIPVLSVGATFAEVLAAVTGDDPGDGCPSGFEPGDVNMDGAINLLDVGPFVAELSGGSTLCEADVNGDGTVNLLDVGPFVDLLGGG